MKTYNSWLIKISSKKNENSKLKSSSTCKVLEEYDLSSEMTGFYKPISKDLTARNA